MSPASPAPADQSSNEAATPRWPAYSGATAWSFMITALLVVIGSLVIRHAGLPKSVNITIALIPLPGLAAIIVFGLRCIRSMDELERRIQVETLALSFGILGASLVTYGQLQSSGVFSKPEHWSMLWPMMWALYIAMFAWVRRRYQ